MPEDDRSMWCLVYEYAGGGTLADVLRYAATKGETFGWRKRVQVAISVASALESLHKCGCSHRDVRPQNICFADESLERVVLIEFGLAKFVDDVQHTRTMTQRHGWSRPYVAPEYMMGKTRFDEKCEVYSFGFVLQALLTGRLPSASDSPLRPSALARHAKREITDWEEPTLQRLSVLTANCLRGQSE